MEFATSKIPITLIFVAYRGTSLQAANDGRGFFTRSAQLYNIALAFT
jgi:hypothetical protein